MYVVGEDISDYDCCGSTIPQENKTKTIQPFHQMSVGYSFFKLNGIPKLEDHFPPNRILDLHVSMKAKSSLNIQLEWTAPGADHDFGTG